ncbi:MULTISPECIES: AAA family ATPase [unclassified Brevibacterium]|uniref:ATP-dependent nuclease n=1 Tax=unclassified Brevibacterium TaxID=2614124 RepID=UPI001E617292|nr:MULTISPECIES: AAA family ATPase [unclassified Brevibacterium]MCD1287804.1 ATP-dependent endonuclease [Brevibacterium sp. CCUG 69071]MDK8435087.1 AAA family ATPase [Brevibacterium sp. H-BE7]
MRVSRLQIKNFRGISEGRVDFNGNALLVAGNSVGKSTVCEALDLVLGPERMLRRPIIDEYDFFGAKYQPDTENTPQIEIEVVLVDLDAAAEVRFGDHLRKWSETDRDFADHSVNFVDNADQHPWCLPLLFLGRFDPEEDDFEGNTFFAHPAPIIDDLSEDTDLLGQTRRRFSREDKRYCGYLYLRTTRTGTRALSFQRGSLLDTIVRLEDQATGELWERARMSLTDLNLLDESKLDVVLDEVRQRVSRFMALGGSEVGLHLSDLTRESIRETLRVFVTASPGEHAVPFNRLSTGSLNLLVFALLTYIAELKGDESVIFAMEEPEIALPPHSQRRLVDFVTSRMGQAIVTSHSPYVIERFSTENILMLTRSDDGVLTSDQFNVDGLMKPKKIREERRQFAEAILARGVLVVEGGTEASVIPVVADILDADPSVEYTHLDLAGVSIYDAKSDGLVPGFAPVFKSLGKRCYGLHDAPNSPFPTNAVANAEQFDEYLEIPHKSIEKLLIAEMPERPKRSFLIRAEALPDYPSDAGYLSPGADAASVDALVESVLVKRKGAYNGYAAMLVAEAKNASELPSSYVQFLHAIDADMASIGTKGTNNSRGGGLQSPASEGMDKPTPETLTGPEEDQSPGIATP